MARFLFNGEHKSDDDGNELLLPILSLNNAKSIVLIKAALPFICSYKCKSLDLIDIKITNQMYHLLINKCDLSGVKKLNLSKLSIVNDIDHDIQNGHGLALIGKKMTSIEQIKVEGLNQDTITFIESLEASLIKNNAKFIIWLLVELGYDDKILRQTETYGKLMNFIAKNKFGVSDIKLHTDERSLEIFKKIFWCEHICSNVKILRIIIDHREMNVLVNF